MFILNDKYYKVQTWFHDLLNNLTQATVYKYGNEADLLAHENQEGSDIHQFAYNSELESFAGIEAAILAKLTAPPAPPVEELIP